MARELPCSGRRHSQCRCSFRFEHALCRTYCCNCSAMFASEGHHRPWLLLPSSSACMLRAVRSEVLLAEHSLCSAGLKNLSSQQRRTRSCRTLSDDACSSGPKGRGRAHVAARTLPSHCLRAVLVGSLACDVDHRCAGTGSVPAPHLAATGVRFAPVNFRWSDRCHRSMSVDSRSVRAWCRQLQSESADVKHH